MGLFGNNKELQLGTCGLMGGEARASPENKREDCSFIEEKGVQSGCPLEGTGSSKCSGFSLAEWLPGKKILFLPAGVSMIGNKYGSSSLG